MNRTLLLLTVAAGLAATVPVIVFAGQPLPAPWSGRVVKVVDGDTIVVLREGRGQKIRLYGVDTPESGQAFGRVAKRFASRRAAQRTARIEPVATDRYGRVVALVHLGDDLLNEALVGAGLAWVYERYCKRRPLCGRWKSMQGKARRAKRGLWADANPTPPWDWRLEERSSRPAPRTEAPATAGPYHGNTRSHVFHRPGCRAYRCRSCTAILPTREQAIRDGFRPCGQCKP